eukprot:Gb_27168 [translate_table: standard]
MGHIVKSSSCGFLLARSCSKRSAFGFSFPSTLQLVHQPRRSHCGFVLSSQNPSSNLPQQTQMTISSEVKAPVAEKVEHTMEMFGDVRKDYYYWLRDDSRSNPKVLSHLHQENAYTESLMSDTKQLQEELYKELRGRIQEADATVPLRKGTYFYYEKTLEGKQYRQHCRRFIVDGEGPGSVDEVMETGPDAPAEEILFDENLKAEIHEYYNIGAFKVSPNHKLIAYAEDTKGDEIYTVYVIDAENKEFVGKPLTGITDSVEWADNDTLVYITMDDIHRPYKVWRHHLGSNQSDDTCLYHEKDDEYSLELHASESKQFLFVLSGSKTTQFVLFLDVSDAQKELKYLTQRVEGVDTEVSHRGNNFFIKRRSDEVFNSELLVCPIDDVTATTVLLPHRPSVKLQEVQTFKDYLVVYERENGLVNVIVYRLPPNGEAIKSLSSGQTVQFIDPIYSVSPLESQFNSCVLRYEYSSLRTPPSVYDYDMNNGKSVLKKVEPVLGGFEEEKYETIRRWAVASDGTQVPISIVYRKDLVKLDGTDSLLLYGYGSYEVCIDPDFRATRLSLIDRGFVYAIAHIRGGGEMGRKWYEDGKLLKKRNTFTDFIACAEYLLDNKYGSKDKLCIHGRSAGGLLIGTVLNMRPDLFKSAVAGVPFVDVVTTMLDSSIPLTTAEWEEWGDPRKEEYYFYMKSYSPLDNVQAQNYPNILVTAGLNDPRVLYSEPAKYVAKLRENKTDNNILLFKCELGAGHFSKSGRFDKLQEDAFTFAFILKSLGLISDGASVIA